MPSREKDPNQIKVQLNVPVTFEFMNHLDQLSIRSKISRAKIVRAALESTFPLPLTSKRAADDIVSAVRHEAATRP